MSLQAVGRTIDRHLLHDPGIEMTFAPRHRWSLRTSFWLVVSAQVLLFTGSNLPTPLFPIYEQRYRFHSAVVTLLFGVYVAVLIPTLLFLGPVSDRVGRKPLLVAGIGVTAVSSAAFALAQNAAWLFAGEIVYGIGAGAVMACVAAAIRELHPRAHVGGAALAASVAAAAGLALGPLVSGVLASTTPWPTVAPFVLDIVLAVLLAGALTRIPETRPAAVDDTAHARFLRVPSAIRDAFATTAVAGAASFMIVGWVFGLSPSYLHEELGVHVTQPIVAGLFATLVVVANGAAQLTLRRHHSATTMRTALAAIAAGMGLMAASTLTNSLAVALVGAVVAGAGSGMVQMNAMATIQRIAPTHARGALTSTYFTCCYLGLSVPVIVAGVVADHSGLGVVSAGFAVVLTGVATVAVVTARRAFGSRIEAESAEIELLVERDAA